MSSIHVIVCSTTKKANNEVKLWIDGASFANIACRPTSNQFGIFGIQVTGATIYLYVLMNDASEIPRYFHLDHLWIPIYQSVDSTH